MRKRGRSQQNDYTRSGWDDLVAEIEDEFFWNLKEAVGVLKVLGFQTGSRRFSDLFWGIVARKQT